MEEKYRIDGQVKIWETMVPMRDGVKLYTRVSMLAGMEKGPILFTRNPYEPPHNGEPHQWDENSEEGLFNKGGYVFIMQHCRGKADSEGFCIPYAEAERNDGIDTLEWLRKQDFYDGEIYIHGGSYTSTVHYLYLDTLPPDVKGACLSIQSCNRYCRYYRNGMPVNTVNLDWWRFMMERKYPNSKLEGSFVRPYEDTALRAFGEKVPDFDGILVNTEDSDDFWQKQLGRNGIDYVRFPILFTDGWYDWNVGEMFAMWQSLPEEIRKKSCFRMGPWGHAFFVDHAEFPLPNANMPADWAVRWFNSIRSGKEDPYYPLGKVTYYSIGGEGYKTTPYPAASKGKKRWYFGIGTLQDTPVKRVEHSYTYDPEGHKAVFKFGSMCKAFPAKVENGVISFQTAPFKEEMSFFGKLRWRMKVSSDCEDTAFFVRLFIGDETGLYNLTENITALSRVCKNYKPGKEALIDLCCHEIGFTVPKDKFLAVQIASEGTDWVPHANVKGHWAEVTETKIAHNTVICDDDAFIEMPICE